MNQQDSKRKEPTTVHHKGTPAFLKALDEIVEFLRHDPDELQLVDKPRRPHAVRWAVRVAVKHVRELRRQRAETAEG